MGSLVTVCHNMISHRVVYYPSEKMEKISEVINYIPKNGLNPRILMKLEGNSFDYLNTKY